MGELVFVYGTLMRGEGNYRRFFQGNPEVEFVDEGVAEGLGLYNVTKYYPGAVREEGAFTKGEVFRVSRRVLRKLDRLEDEGDLYIRQKMQVRLKSGTTVEAWVYLWNRRPDPRTRVWENEQPWCSPGPTGKGAV
ncbi:MAG: gamma-glutamylcyclotransferase [Syntrophomonadaceae bacterium]|nr:gamma-glutamylcyclotransferase [Syntrophomonadaceae bacterium]